MRPSYFIDTELADAWFNESLTYDGKEFRETDEIGDYAVEATDSVLSDDETARAGIPDDPEWVAIVNDQITTDVAHYDKWLASNDLDDDVRRKFQADREVALAYEKACEEWEPHYKLAVEYPASRIFVALRDGSLRAQGRSLPAVDRDKALSMLEAAGRSVFEIAPTGIPSSFWSLQGIDFEASAAKGSIHHYCHISLLTEEVLSVFPGEKQEVTGVERVGDCYVLSDKARARHASAHRGRPPLPWDAFHIEVTSLLQRNELPEKKESAIEYFRSWFQREHGIKASRSVVGEKLKPYYDKFIRAVGQKTR